MQEELTMDIFSAARQKIGNMIAGNQQVDPLLVQAIHLLEDEPSLSDADLMQELGLSREKDAKRYRVAAQDLIAKGQGSQSLPAPLSPQQLTQAPTTQPLNGQVTTIWQQTGKNTATMTPEELTARRQARVENAPVGRSTHDKFMLWVKGAWRIIGPVWFVVVTAGEVVDYLNHYMPHADPMTQILIWGVALFLEISMMIATYDLSGRNRIEAEKRGAGIEVSSYERKRKYLAMLFWFLLAAANITGQAAFLWFVTHPDAIPGGPTRPVDQ